MSIEKECNQIKTGERLRSFRKRKGMNTVEFSKICGISQGSLSGLENGKSYPSAETLINLLLYTDIDIAWLLTGKETFSSKPEIDPFISEIDEWVKETTGEGTSHWFKNQFIRNFSDFEKWKERKEGWNEDQHIPPLAKVA